MASTHAQLREMVTHMTLETLPYIIKGTAAECAEFMAKHILFRNMTLMNNSCATSRFIVLWWITLKGPPWLCVGAPHSSACPPTGLWAAPVCAGIHSSRKDCSR